MSRRAASASGAFVLLALAGCSNHRELVATPNLVCQQDATYFAACPECVKSPDMPVIYVTDRALEHDRYGPLYGYGRAKRLSYGTVDVALTPNPTWEELLADSTRRDRRHSYTLAPGACRELGAFDFLWEQLREAKPEAPQPGESFQIPAEQQQAFRQMIAERLAPTEQKDVFVFIHGFNNSFADAVYRAGQVWHFLGRVGVPIAYSWPAGRGGPLGYLYDRESGEFTVFHLKQFLRCLAACPIAGARMWRSLRYASCTQGIRPRAVIRASS
jgi:esterase/lipase superfamily enzyme